MNKSRLLLLALLFLGTFSSGQDLQTQKKWAQLDSIELATLPDSIRQKPKKMYPNAPFHTWTVTGLYDKSSDSKYKRPKPYVSTYHRKDSAKQTGDDQAMITYTCMVSDPARGDANDAIAKYTYYRLKDSREVKLYSIEKYYLDAELIKVVPAPVLEKIRTELKQQAGENIDALSVLELGDLEVYESEYSDHRGGNWTGNKKVDQKSFYKVWGDKTNQLGNYAMCLFTMDGSYIPNVTRDRKVKKMKKR